MTGFGKEIVFRLVAEGFVVFADVWRRDESSNEGLPSMALMGTSDEAAAPALFQENWPQRSSKLGWNGNAPANNAGMGRHRLSIYRTIKCKRTVSIQSIKMITEACI
jgi:hypothetical protein